MDMSMFTGFEGRINRAKWWLGAIILLVVGVIIAMILSAILGASMWGGATVAPDGTITYDLSVLRLAAIAQLITFVIVVYPWLSLTTKRLNDRDRPRALAYVFLLPSVLSILVGLLGLATMTSIAWLTTLITLAIGIWALVELGILKGTTGPNANGPDPLGA